LKLGNPETASWLHLGTEKQKTAIRRRDSIESVDNARSLVKGQNLKKNIWDFVKHMMARKTRD